MEAAPIRIVTVVQAGLLGSPPDADHRHVISQGPWFGPRFTRFQQRMNEFTAGTARMCTNKIVDTRTSENFTRGIQGFRDTIGTEHNQIPRIQGNDWRSTIAGLIVYSQDQTSAG